MYTVYFIKYRIFPPLLVYNKYMETKSLIDKKLGHRKNMPDIIAEALREAIFNGELKGGQSLKQEEIAGMFSASLIPVREALRRLEAQGLVKIFPNRGAIVSELSADEVRELFEIRILLEKGALEFAIDNLTDEDLAYAESLLKQMDIITDGSTLSQLNWEFHFTLYKASGRMRLMELIENMHLNVERYMRIYLLDMHYHPTSQEEHYKLIKACRAKDSKAACALLQQHMEKACNLLAEFLSSNSN